jgi:hypothetical protein
VAGPDTPQAGNTVYDLSTVVGREMHAIGLDEDSGLFAEVPIARKGQPLVLKIDAHLSSGTLRLSGEIVVSHGLSPDSNGSKNPF